jgi:hypothetical protein
MGDEAPEPAQAPLPERVGDTMENQGMDAGITGEHFPGRPSRRVTVENRPDVFTQLPKKHDARISPVLLWANCKILD